MNTTAGQNNNLITCPPVPFQFNSLDLSADRDIVRIFIMLLFSNEFSDIFLLLLFTGAGAAVDELAIKNTIIIIICVARPHAIRQWPQQPNKQFENVRGGVGSRHQGA
jgi:hypothetical protein